MESGEQSVLSPEERLVSNLENPEYRRAFVEGHATDTIAFQLRAMRKEEGWDQRDVAEKLGNRSLQPMVSRYENPDYGKYSISTLLELSAVFDVALAVRFVPFSELVEWDLSTSAEKICPISFAKDEQLQRIANRAHEPKGILESNNYGRIDQSAAGFAATSGEARTSGLGSIFAGQTISSATRPGLAA